MSIETTRGSSFSSSSTQVQNIYSPSAVPDTNVSAQSSLRLDNPTRRPHDANLANFKQSIRRRAALCLTLNTEFRAREERGGERNGPALTPRTLDTEI